MVEITIFSKMAMINRTIKLFLNVLVNPDVAKKDRKNIIGKRYTEKRNTHDCTLLRRSHSDPPIIDKVRIV